MLIVHMFTWLLCFCIAAFLVLSTLIMVGHAIDAALAWFSKKVGW